LKNNKEKFQGVEEKKGISNQKTTNDIAVKKLKQKRQNKRTVEELFLGITSGNTTTLSQGITLIESAKQEDRFLANTLIDKCLNHPLSSPTLRIGITGVPGVGKSTFIEALGKHLVTQHHKIAVLAIDPSSSKSKGSILGDKTRMTELVRKQNVFIRPTASGSTLGGVGQYTREAIILCEAAGYDIILIETVGVGQGETAVYEMVDFFLLLKLAGAGDELQGIKRGIIEMADAVLINKADGANIDAAKLAMSAFSNALHLYAINPSKWSPKAMLCSALENSGIIEAWYMIESYVKLTKSNNYFFKKREEQNVFWMMQSIENQLRIDLFQHKKTKEFLKKQIELVKENKVSPFGAAMAVLDHHKSLL
jgi:LAO/AO transport system kinase